MTIYYTHKYKELNCKSHDLLEAAIADYTGDKELAKELRASISYEYRGEEKGKPYIKGFDNFSISHSDSSWAVLIDKRICGLDIQYERGCSYLSIASRFFDKEDAALIAGINAMGGHAEADARAEFFRIWAKREALVKAIGSSVVIDGLPPVGAYKSAVVDGRRYYIANIEMPDSSGLYSAICLDAEESIDEKLIYKEMYVRK